MMKLTIKKKYRKLKRHHKLYVLNYFDESVFIKSPYSAKYIVKIIEWILFKQEYNVDQPTDIKTELKLSHIVELLVKYYNSVKLPFNNSRKQKYKYIPHVDEAFICFFYFDKTRLHYDRTLFRPGIYTSISKLRTGKICNITV